MTGFIKQPRNPQRPQPQQRGFRFGFGPFNRPNQFPNQFRIQIRIQTG